MLVSKNNIKIVLLLIFTLVIFQISKTSPNNYLAYSLVAVGFYLVYTELDVEAFKSLREKMEDVFEEGTLEQQFLNDIKDKPEYEVELVEDEEYVDEDEEDEEDEEDVDVDEDEEYVEDVEDEGLILNPLPSLPTEPEIMEETNDNTDLMQIANELQNDRTNELESLKAQLIGTSSNEQQQIEKNGVSCDCNKAIADAIAPLNAEVSKLRDAQKVSVNETEAKLKTYQLLVDYLMEKGVLNKDDSSALKSKMASGILTVDEAISRLEKMKLVARNMNTPSKSLGDKNWWSEMSKSELPQAMYVPLGSQIDSDFSNDYSILNTEKWTVPMARPPVCIDSAPKEVMAIGTSGFPLNLKHFDDSRYVSTSASQEKLKKELFQ